MHFNIYAIIISKIYDHAFELRFARTHAQKFEAFYEINAPTRITCVLRFSFLRYLTQTWMGFFGLRLFVARQSGIYCEVLEFFSSVWLFICVTHVIKGSHRPKFYSFSWNNFEYTDLNIKNASFLYFQFYFAHNKMFLILFKTHSKANTQFQNISDISRCTQFHLSCIWLSVWWIICQHLQSCISNDSNKQFHWLCAYFNHRIGIALSPPNSANNVNQFYE